MSETSPTKKIFTLTIPRRFQPMVQILPDRKLVILITGDREWDDQEAVDSVLDAYKDRSVTLIHGDCRGADKMAGLSALRFPSWTVLSSPADWKRYGRGAGPRRNAEMVKQAVDLESEGMQCIVLAFYDCLEKSKGTADCVKKALKAGLNVKYIAHEN